jgi:hypothetical protein
MRLRNRIPRVPKSLVNELVARKIHLPVMICMTIRPHSEYWTSRSELKNLHLRNRGRQYILDLAQSFFEELDNCLGIGAVIELRNQINTTVRIR